MAKTDGDGKEVNLSELKDIQSLAASNTATMYPSDVKFDTEGRTLVTNSKVNEYIKETLVESGAIKLSPGGDQPEPNEITVNIICDIHVNLRKGCSKNDKD